MLWNTPNSGEPTIAARARCLITMIINIAAVADPAAIGIDLNKNSAARPLELPISAKTARLRCLRSIGHELGLIPLRHPSSKDVYSCLRPGTVSPRRRRRHHRTADSADPVINDCRVRLDVLVAGKVERLAHCLNVAFRKKRKNVALEACHFHDRVLSGVPPFNC